MFQRHRPVMCQLTVCWSEAQGCNMSKEKGQGTLRRYTLVSQGNFIVIKIKGVTKVGHYIRLRLKQGTVDIHNALVMLHNKQSIV